MFVHVSIYHLAINLFFLSVIGTALEVERGRREVLATFLLGGFSPSLLIGIPSFLRAPTSSARRSRSPPWWCASLVAIPDRSAPFFLFRAPLGPIAVIYLVFNGFLAYNRQASRA